MAGWLKGLFFDNFLIKVFSVIFAVILWLHVVSKGTTEVNFAVPLELRDMPENMSVVGEVPGYVDVRLQGQEGVVRRLTVKDIRAYVSLSDSKPGEQVFYLTSANVNAPGNIKIASISPPEVRLRLDKLLRMKVPVRPDITGKPAPGYRLAGVETSPVEVTAIGTEASLRKLRSVTTETIDIEGATGSFDRLVRIDAGAVPSVKVDEGDARVSVTLSKTRKHAREASEE